MDEKIDHLTKLIEKNEHEAKTRWTQSKKQEEVYFKGINIRRIYASNPYAYELQLMNVLWAS